jgi:flagellar biosynthesis component FlhA
MEIHEADGPAPKEAPAALSPVEHFIQGSFGPYMAQGDAFDELILHVGGGLFELEGVYAFIDGMLNGYAKLRKRIYRDTGVILPVCRFRDEAKIGSEAVFLFRGKEAFREAFDPEKNFSEAKALWETSVASTVTLKPGEIAKVSTCDGSNMPDPTPEDAKHPIVGWAYVLLNAMHNFVRKNITKINTLEHTARILEGTRSRYPALVEAAVPALFSLTEIWRIYNLLLADGMSIHSQLSLLEGLIEYITAEPEGDVPGAAEYLKVLM